MIGLAAHRIDLHAHFIPDFYRDVLVAEGQDRPDGIPGLPPWNVTDALATMDRLDVRTAMLSISSPGVHFGDATRAVDLARRVNDEGARLVREYPYRFGLFASLPVPEMDDAVRETRYALDVLGADGIILETNCHGMYLGDQRLDPIYAEVAERKAVVFVHPISPPGVEHIPLPYPAPLLEFMFDTTRSIVDLVLSGMLNRHPGLRVIVPHAGAALPVVVNRADLLAPLLVTSGESPLPSLRTAMQRLHFDLAGAPVEEQLRALLGVTPPTNIHYGSDFPFTPEQACHGLGQQLAQTPTLDDTTRAQMFWGNSIDLFPRLASGLTT
jgi:predicted TIM-barrel fold metal-dependent hydrolase